jgi:hypothetical protein
MLCSNTSSFWNYISKQLEHHPPSLRRSHIDVQVDMWIVGVVLPVAHGDQLACRALVRNARITQRENGKSKQTQNTQKKYATLPPFLLTLLLPLLTFLLSQCVASTHISFSTREKREMRRRKESSGRMDKCGERKGKDSR